MHRYALREPENNLQSRTLYALARQGQAPAIFMRRNTYQVPWVGVALSALPGALAYLTLGHVTSVSVQYFYGRLMTSDL
jgi:amino acid permease